MSKIRVFSNAERSGLKERDFLISINGKEVVVMMRMVLRMLIMVIMVIMVVMVIMVIIVNCFLCR